MKAALALEAIKFLAPLVTKKKKKSKPVNSPVYPGSPAPIRDLSDIQKPEREFDLKRTIISLIVSAALAYGVSQKWITTEEADVIDDIVIEKIDEATD